MNDQIPFNTTPAKPGMKPIYPWETMEVGQWFAFREGVKISSAQIYSYQKSTQLGKKFRVKQGIDQFVGKIYCLRIE